MRQESEYITLHGKKKRGIAPLFVLLPEVGRSLFPFCFGKQEGRIFLFQRKEKDVPFVM